MKTSSITKDTNYKVFRGAIKRDNKINVLCKIKCDKICHNI